MPETHDETLTAHHEAGHAVLAQQLGVDVHDLTIEGEEEKNGGCLWTGHVKWGCDGPKESPDVVAKIMLGGALAEIKFCAAEEFAEQHSGRAPSSISISEACLPNVLDVLLITPDLEKDDRRLDANDCYVSVSLRIDREDFTARMNLCECAGDMKLLKKALGDRFQRDSLMGPFKEVWSIIDDPKAWNLVLRLAKEVTEREPRPFVQKSLKGEYLTKLLKS